MGHVRKIQRLMDTLARLRNRMVERGVEEKVATGIVEDLMSFANYGFPESHAWSFALIAYATAWLKAHYPAEFFAALLNSWPMGFYPPSTLIHDARRHGVVVRPPCMRDGDWECTTEPLDRVGVDRANETAKMESVMADFERERRRYGLAPDGPALRVGWRHIRGLGDKTLDALRLARGGKSAIGVGTGSGKSRAGRSRAAVALEDFDMRSLPPDRPFTSIEDVVLRGKLKRADALQLASRSFRQARMDPHRAWILVRRNRRLHMILQPLHEQVIRHRARSQHHVGFDDHAALGMSGADHRAFQHVRP